MVKPMVASMTSTPMNDGRCKHTLVNPRHEYLFFAWGIGRQC